MKKRTRYPVAAFIVTVLVVLAAVLSGARLVREPVLVIQGADGKVLAKISLPDGRFDHVFIHSIHLTPVEECFRVEQDGKGPVLHLFELRYRSSGVGMPSDAEGGYRLEHGVFILSMNRVFRTIPVMVSIVDGHGIVAGGVFHPFRTWVKAEDRILLSGRMTTVLHFRR